MTEPAVTDNDQPAATNQSDSHSSREADITRAVSDLCDRRAVIEQVKGVLMCVYRLDADAAFELLRSRSMEANVKLRVLAEQLMTEFRTLIPDGAPMPSRSEFERILLTAHERV